MFDPAFDLEITRVIRAPRQAVWNGWADADLFATWWLPAPSVLRVLDLDLRAGGAFRTEMSDDGVAFVPHMDAVFLDVVELERIVFTTALVADWRPATRPFITSVITLSDHPDGTEYHATAMHKDAADRDTHSGLGFHAGWGLVLDQLAARVE